MIINQLTFTRFIAAISIVVFHFGNYVPPFNLNGFSTILPYLNAFVSYFFVLSGFILVVSTKPSNSFSFASFIKKRISRIYPMYFLAFITYLLILAIAPNPVIHTELPGVVSNILLIQSWIPDFAQSYNYPGWSLSAELFFYLLFPLTFTFLTRKSNTQILLSVVVTWAIGIAAYVYAYHTLPLSVSKYNPLLHCSSFIWGVGTGVLFVRFYDVLQANRYTFYFSIFSVLCFLLPFLISSSIRSYYHNVTLAPLFSSVILSLCFMPQFLKRVFSHKFCLMLGESSYSVYILQVPVAVVYYGISKRYFHLSGTADFYLFLVVLIITSIAALYIIEKPARTYLNKLLKA